MTAVVLSELPPQRSAKLIPLLDETVRGEAVRRMTCDQATPREAECDQQFTMRPDGSDLSLVSTGVGRTTCGYFLPGNEKIVYSSTHLGGDECPAEPDRSQGYVWALYEDYDVFLADADGLNLERLTDAPGYDAEATLSRDGEWSVFTSARDRDLAKKARRAQEAREVSDPEKP